MSRSNLRIDVNLAILRMPPVPAGQCRASQRGFYAVAPCNVAGASPRRDGANHTWIRFPTMISGQAAFIRRPDLTRNAPPMRRNGRYRYLSLIRSWKSAASTHRWPTHLQGCAKERHCFMTLWPLFLFTPSIWPEKSKTWRGSAAMRSAAASSGPEDGCIWPRRNCRFV